MMPCHSKKPEVKKKAVKKAKYPKNCRDRALKSLQRLRRLQEADDNGYVYCISCGKPMLWNEAQGGHYITRGNRATELEPDNIWPQCPYCNGMLSGNIQMYRRNLVNKIGVERVERIENMAFARMGNEDALSKLSDEDKELAMMKKSNVYYYEKAKGFDTECKILEGKE